MRASAYPAAFCRVSANFVTRHRDRLDLQRFTDPEGT
jgi:hypothetical protein